MRISMNYLKNQVLTEKSIRLLQKNQYTFDVTLESNKTEIKDWIENFFNVKVESINSHRLPIKRRKSKICKNLVYGKRIIIKLQNGYYIPLFLNE